MRTDDLETTGQRHRAPGVRGDTRTHESPGQVLPSVATYALVSPVRSEAENLERIAGCLESQTVKPSRWIIIDNGSMVFAKASDKLSNGYSVVKVEEMSVTLVDATGITQTIRLP